MRCWVPALVTPALMAAAAAPAAASTCSVPDEPAWHSCLSTVHRQLDRGRTVLLTQAKPTLAIRYRRCPSRTIRQTVTLRTGDGATIAERRVRGRCRNGAVRLRTTLG